MNTSELKARNEQNISKAKEKFLNGTASQGEMFLLSLYVSTEYAAGGEKRKLVADFLKSLPQDSKVRIGGWLEAVQNTFSE